MTVDNVPYPHQLVIDLSKVENVTGLDVYKRQTYRGGDWLDFAANTTGAVLASLVAYYVVRPRMKINKQ